VGGKEVKGKRMSRWREKVPYPLGTEEWESFKNFAVEHYKNAIEIAKKSVEATDINFDIRVFIEILSKTASPLVYLWEQWQLLNAEQRSKYATPSYLLKLKSIMKEVSDIKASAKKVWEEVGEKETSK